MKENTKDKIYTIFTVVVILIILAVGIFNWLPVLKQYFGLKQKEAAKIAEIEEVDRENAECIERTRSFGSNPELVEAVARQDLRVRPTERVYIFNEEDEK